MERCSVCKGRLKDNTCSRCGADLAIPLTIEQQAASKLHQALEQLSIGNLEGAVLEIERSLQLKREPLALALYGFINSIPLSKLQMDVLGMREVLQ